MTILYRYLAKQSLFLLFVILLAGTGIYAITDLFENLDHFLENDTGILIVALYIGLKIPNIISQILPAVFFVATILQLNILERSNELTAIRAGGISPSIIIKFICILHQNHSSVSREVRQSVLLVRELESDSPF